MLPRSADSIVSHTTAPLRHSATLLILRSQAAFAATAVLAKFIEQTLQPPVVTGWILLLGPLFAFLYCAYHGELKGLKAVDWRWAATRSALVAMALICSYFGFAHLELATAIALSFLTPIFITLLAMLILKEKVGWHRRCALIAGIVGMLCIARPGMLWNTENENLWQGQLAMVLSAACFAVSVIVMKRQLRRELPSANFLGTALCGAVLALPLFGWDMIESLPDAKMASALLLMATMSSLAVICNAEAHQRAEASYLAPFTYLQLIWVAAAGLLFWGEWPDGPTWGGAALIIASGLYTAYRERKLGIDR